MTIENLPVPERRPEYYLAYLCGSYSGELQEPVVRYEQYLAYLCGVYPGELPQPVLRFEYYLAFLCGVYSGPLQAPIAHEDYYLATICGVYSDVLPEPVTRWEIYLYYLATNGGGNIFESKTASGVAVEVSDSSAQSLNSLTLYGWSTQDGTPTPDNPIDIVSAGDSGEVTVTLADGSGNTQTLILAAANGLPGVPVSSGGNYTDENGQQWIADEIVLNADGSGVYRQNVGSLTIDGTSIYFTSIYSDAYWRLPYYVAPDIAPYSVPVLCNYTTVLKSNPEYEFIYIIASRISDYFTSIDELNEHVVASNDAGKPWVILYATNTPKETALTADEFAAFLALKTYNGTTIITNDADAYMEIGYKAIKG